MIVTIDGPAGAGKSSVARKLAARLGFAFLDTGAMYRAVTLAALRAGVAWDPPEHLAEFAVGLEIEAIDGQVLLNGEEVSAAVRAPEVTAAVHYAADNVAVREVLVNKQRRAAERGSLVTDGRDQATIVFPHAECKIFLTASPEERARRRVAQLRTQGVEAPFEEVLREQNERDARDSGRAVGRLEIAEDALLVATDGLTEEEVVERLVDLVSARRAS